MRTAVVYYSLTGNTEDTARKIAEEISADLILLEAEKAYPDSGFRKFYWGGKSAVMGEMPKLKAYEFDVSKYDLIVFGTPVWAGTFNPCIRTFVHDNKEALKGKECAVFCCHSGGGGEKTFRKLKEYLGIEKWKAELSLIDPKEKPSKKNEMQIKQFCEKIQEESK